MSSSIDRSLARIARDGLVYVDVSEHTASRQVASQAITAAKQLLASGAPAAEVKKAVEEFKTLYLDKNAIVFEESLGDIGYLEPQTLTGRTVTDQIVCFLDEMGFPYRFTTDAVHVALLDNVPFTLEELGEWTGFSGGDTASFFFEDETAMMKMMLYLPGCVPINIG